MWDLVLLDIHWQAPQPEREDFSSGAASDPTVTDRLFLLIRQRSNSLADYH